MCVCVCVCEGYQLSGSNETLENKKKAANVHLSKRQEDRHLSKRQKDKGLLQMQKYSYDPDTCPLLQQDHMTCSYTLYNSVISVKYV